MQEMYKQGFIDGVNLIMECKNNKKYPKLEITQYNFIK